MAVLPTVFFVACFNFLIIGCMSFTCGPKVKDAVEVTLESVLHDVAWLQSLVASGSSIQGLAGCKESDILPEVPPALSFIDFINDTLQHLVYDTDLDSCNLELQDIVHATFIFDRSQIDWMQINEATWFLFFLNFILTSIYGLKTIWSKEENSHRYTGDYKPRRKRLFKKSGRQDSKGRKKKSLSPSRRERLNQNRPLLAHVLLKQLNRQYKSHASAFTKTNNENDIFKIKKVEHFSLRNKSKSKLGSNPETDTSPKRSPTIGKIYNLDDAENIPWEILDILLCIRNPCYEHDHDHICVVGNHVYTIPKWSIPNTSSVLETPEIYEQMKYTGYYDDDMRDNGDDEFGAGDGDRGYDNDDENELDDEELQGFYESSRSQKIDVSDYIFEPIVIEVHDEARSSVHGSNKKLNPPIIDIPDGISLASGEPDEEHPEQEEEDEVFVKNVEPKSFKEQLLSNAVKVTENMKKMVEGVCVGGKTIVNKLYPKKTKRDLENDKVLQRDQVICDEDIGLPCAHSSFKSEIDDVYANNLIIKHCFTDDHEVSWVEEDISLTNTDTDISNPLSSPSSFNEVDFNLSQYLHNLSLRLSKDAHHLHDLNKTMSFYGDVSVFELGASWMVRSLLNHVIEDLNISSKVHSLQEDVTGRFSSLLNRTR